MDITGKVAMVLIDVQKGIDERRHWGENRNNPDAEQHIQTLLSFWRRLGFPVIIVRHDSTSATSPFRPGYAGNELEDLVARWQVEKTIIKSTTSAFIKTDLSEYLQQQQINKLVNTGFVKNNAVEATARNAGYLSFKTYLVSDATACFDKKGLDGRKYNSDLIHQISLSNLEGEYDTIVSAKELCY